MIRRTLIRALTTLSASLVLADNYPYRPITLVLAPAILGVVLGTMMEENFVTSMIKSDGDPLVFFTRPIAMWLAAGTLLILIWPVITWAWRRSRPPVDAASR